MNSRDNSNLERLTKRLIKCEQENEHVKKKYDKLKEHYKVVHDERENLIFHRNIDLTTLNLLLERFWFLKHEAQRLPDYPDVMKKYALLQEKHGKIFEEYEKKQLFDVESKRGQYPDWI